MQISDHLETVLDSTHESIMFADREGLIRLWNKGSERLFGFSRSEVIGQSLDVIIPENLRKAHWKGFFEAIERGETLPDRKPATTKALHRGGGNIDVEMSFSMVHDEAGRVIGSVAVGRLNEGRTRLKNQSNETAGCPFGAKAQ